MTELFNSFISKAFLRSVWMLEFEAFKGSDDEAALDDRLQRWASRKDLRETSAEPALIEEFFRETWGYEQSGQASADAGTFTLWPKFPVPGAGEKGGVGTADLAIGYFHKEEENPVPQVLCEFKDIRSGLDAPQKRKGNNRSPARQCLDYLSYARRGLFPSDPILPTWGIVTDMNEFRLYWFDKVDGARSFDRHPSKSLGLYTLGRIFEQSITELEILEAEADGRPSVNKESKRKRDGVYYTPEWVVERIVDETLGPRLAEIKKECGWPSAGDPTVAALDAYSARLKELTVVDPACGSGAFLITVLRYLIEAWHEVQGLRRQITKGRAERDSDDALITEILKSNIYGVDINPASVEIARLALWLHTARGDKALSSLDENIREGNSLISRDFYKGQIDLALYDDMQKERVNAFDWHEAFPAVFARGGFDAVVGNPPYVKLQNFRTVHADMATFLRDGRPDVSVKPYASTQTGNFDLYC